jgi:hypothetical protein
MAPGHFQPPGKTLYLLYRRLDGSQGRSEQVRKISPPTGIRSPDRPARSLALYWLSYMAYWVLCNCVIYKIMKVKKYQVLLCRVTVGEFYTLNSLTKGQNSLSRSSRLSTSFTSLRYYVSVDVLSVFPTPFPCHQWVCRGFRGSMRVVLKCE